MVCFQPRESVASHSNPSLPNSQIITTLRKSANVHFVPSLHPGLHSLSAPAMAPGPPVADDFDAALNLEEIHLDEGWEDGLRCVSRPQRFFFRFARDAAAASSFASPTTRVGVSSSFLPLTRPLTNQTQRGRNPGGGGGQTNRFRQGVRNRPGDGFLRGVSRGLGAVCGDGP